MKTRRTFTFRPIEYQTALDLAAILQRATETVADEPLKRWVQTLQAWWHSDLFPIVETEETHVLPALADSGHRELSERTIKEHRELEALVYDSDLPCRERLAKFAKLLRAHVQFEERVLVAAARSSLSQNQLSATHFC